jgi:hypothetical protein
MEQRKFKIGDTVICRLVKLSKPGAGFKPGLIFTIDRITDQESENPILWGKGTIDGNGVYNSSVNYYYDGIYEIY